MLQAYYQYWGKAKKTDDFLSQECHLLVYHSLDVAVVAYQYLDRFPKLLEGFSQALGLQKEFARRLLVFLIALHDLGKFSQYFQNKVPALRERLGQSLPLGGSLDHHDVCGQALWQDDLASIFLGKFGLDLCSGNRQAFGHLMLATTGHHGKPVNTTFVKSGNFTEKNKEAAILFARDLFDVIFSGCEDYHFLLQSWDLNTQAKRVSWWLAGLTMLADWVGSNAHFFQYRIDKVPLKDYWRYAGKIATQALDGLGLIKPVIKHRQGFSSVFGYIEKPSVLQRAVLDLELSNQHQLFILEDLTGSGKTEAALFLAYRLMQQGLGDVFYVALPTMATANAMYNRVKDIYPRLFENWDQLSCVLAHGKSQHDQLFQNTLYGSELDLKDEETNASVRCNAWFADNRKKALLAQVGIGTIDQALQAILQNKHQGLRLIGLYRKILIVDEVHACDAYMLTLLEVLLKFQAASGGSVILLSATLPSVMRQSLVKAFYRGYYTEPFTFIRNDAYPLITHLNGESVASVPVAANSHANVMLNVCYFSDPGRVIELVQQAISGGHCICWIRNTVKDAMEAYEQLKTIFNPGDIVLFHARFVLVDRLDIEKRLISDFGKCSLPATRVGKIVIATQVIEQSLDLDFDFMITDLAPIDLVIQRAGRLQRHRRENRNLQRVLYVYGPPLVIDCEVDWYKKHFPSAHVVYENHKQLWLTAKLLQDNPVIDLYQDSRRLIEGVYGDDTIAVPEKLERVADKAYGKAQADRSQADNMSLDFKKGYSSASDSWWDERFCPTRLGEKGVLLYLAKLVDGRVVPVCDDDKAWDMSSVQVRQSWLGVDSEDSMEDLFVVDSEARPLIDVARQGLPDKGKWSYLILLGESYDGLYKAELKNGSYYASVTYDRVMGLSKLKVPA